MTPFYTIKELINAVYRERELLVEVWEKRTSLFYKYEFALDLVDGKEERLAYLIDKSVIRNNGPHIELDEQYHQFFELVLEINEDINTGYIHDSIQAIKQNTNYYLQENNENRKLSYLKAVKSALRKIDRAIVRNVIDLKRNIYNIYSLEPNYKIKISKLNNLDQKRKDIGTLIGQTDLLITEEEKTFFRSATDVELSTIILNLRLTLSDVRHNLIEIQKQIIDYLNQIRYQSIVIEKIRQLKYLKDQFQLRQQSNISEILVADNALVQETRPVSPLKLSLDFLQTDDGRESIIKIAGKIKSGNKPKLPVAEKISDEYINGITETEIFINPEEIKRGFLTSGNHLFDYIMSYSFPKPLSFGEKVTVYCQMVSLFENEFVISEDFDSMENIEYALVFPK